MTDVGGPNGSTHDVTSDAPDRSQERSRPRSRDVISWASIWRVIVAVLATLVGLWALAQMRSLVSMIVISVFLSLALEPGVRWLRQRYGWGRGASVGVIYLVGITFVVLMVVVLVPSIVEFGEQIGTQGPEWASSLNGWTDDTFGFVLLDEETASSTPEDVQTFVADWASKGFGGLTDIASAGATFAFSLGTIAMFTFYFTADSPRLTRIVLSWFKPETQQRVGWTYDEAIVQTGGYFYSRTLLMIINGLGFFITMVLVGMPVLFAFPLSVFGSFVSVFIPVIGTYLGAAVPILVTLAVQGLVPALVVLGYVLVYQLIENTWLSPNISAKTMNLSGGLAFAAALAGGALAGPVGAFLALPTAALISSFVSNYATTYDVVYDSPSVTDTVEQPMESS